MANLGGVTLSSPPPPPRNDSFHISILRDGWLRCPPSWWHTTKKLIPPVLPFDVLVNKRPEKKFAFKLLTRYGPLVSVLISVVLIHLPSHCSI